jgi:enolase
MPIPEVQIFGGGAHAGRRVDIQDFMVVAPKARSFAEALEWTAEIYRAAGAMMSETGRLQGVADEGGFWPAFDSNEAALDALVGSISRPPNSIVTAPTASHSRDSCSIPTLCQLC